MNLKQLIHQYVDDYMKDKKIYSQIGIVSDIDETKRNCIVTPINGDADRLVRFQASLSLTDGLFIKPVNGSYVLFTYINNETGVIICYSEIEKVILTSDDIEINGGSNGGMVKAGQVASKMNILEDSLNDLKTKLNVWIPVAFDGGASLKVLLADWITSSITNVTQADFENDKIKH